MGESRYFQAGDPRYSMPGVHPQMNPAPYAEPRLTAGAAPVAGYVPRDSWTPPQSYPAGANFAPHPDFGQGPAYAAHPPYPQHPASTEQRNIQTGAVVHGLGAVLSVALLVGAGGWMWQMMQRDVAGVPVVRALEGPLRVAPDDPGGRQAAHQGLAINELSGAREEMPREQIVLAPPPLELGGEDRAGPVAREEIPDFSAEFGEQPIPVALLQPDTQSHDGTGLGMNSPTRRAVAVSPRPVARGTRLPSRDQMQMAALGAAAPEASLPIARDLAASVADSVAMGLSGVRDIDVDPATIGPGTRLVQLGAYDDIAAARAAWDTLANRFSPLLDDRGRVIEAAHSGGSVFYRLRAHGFSDERDARRFCAALVDQQIDCIPVLIR